MKGSRKKLPSQSQPPFGVGMMAPRRTLLPPVDPTMKFSVPSSSAQQIRFQLSGFEEMPEFGESNKMHLGFPAAGRSLPKFRVENLESSVTKMTANPNYQPISPRYFNVGGEDDQKRNKKNNNMLSRFDETISNPNLRVSQVKAVRMKKHIERDLEKRVKNHDRTGSIGADVFRDEMEKMKDQFLGDMTNELGLGFQNLRSPRGRHSQDLQGAKRLDSLDAINYKIDNMISEWGTEAQKIPHNQINPLTLEQTRNSKQMKPSEIRPNAAIPKKRNKPTGKLPGSNDKLAEISLGFRQSLLPISSRDPRELIKTPLDDVVSTLSNAHREGLKYMKKNRLEEDKRRLFSNPKSVGSASILSMKSSLINPRIVGSGVLASNQKKIKGNLTDATGSSDMGGIMDFRALLDAQRKSQSNNQTKTGTGPGTHRKMLTEQLNPHSKSKTSIVPEKKSIQEAPSHGFVSGTPIHGQLKESVKSIDHAAKMAEKLGTLMSRVAVQQNPNSDSAMSSTTTLSSLSSTPQPTMSTNDIRKRALHLRRVAEEAQKSLKMHTVACGNTPRMSNSNISPNLPSSNINRTNRRISETEIQTQTDIMETDTAKDFEFIPDMSYADQLILKKLRGMHTANSSAWSGTTRTPGITSEEKGNKNSVTVSAKQASFASGNRK